ncbi:hypothetical protein Tco_0423420, partial [Tanacetum coccineum]
MILEKLNLHKEIRKEDHHEMILVDGASLSMNVDTGESAISTARGAAATGTGKTAIVEGLKYSSNKGWNKLSQSSLFGGLQ